MSPVPPMKKASQGNIHRLVVDILSIPYLFNVIFIRTSPPIECLELLCALRTVASIEQALAFGVKIKMVQNVSHRLSK